MRSILSVVTRAGWTLLGLASLSLVTGSLAGYRVLVVFGVAGLLLFLAAAVTVALRPSLQVERSIDPPRVTVGDDALGTVVVTNTSRRPSLPQLGRDRVGDKVVDVTLPSLLPGRQKVHRYALPTNKRAAVTVGPFVIRQADPFGLMVRERDHGELLDFFVHPRRYHLDRLPASRRLSLEGPTSDRAPHGSTTFHAIRQYVPGDDRRHIHWKVSARTGDLMVRQLVDTSEPTLVLVLDLGVDRYPDPEHFEGAVEVVASLAEAASANGFPVRVCTTDGDTCLGQQDQPEVLLDRLAGLELVGEGSIEGVAQGLLAGPRGPTLVLVGGRFDAADALAAESLRSHYAETQIVSVGTPGLSLGPDHSFVRGGSEFASLWNGMAIG